MPQLLDDSLKLFFPNLSSFFDPLIQHQNDRRRWGTHRWNSTDRECPDDVATVDAVVIVEYSGKPNPQHIFEARPGLTSFIPRLDRCKNPHSHFSFNCYFNRDVLIGRNREVRFKYQWKHNLFPFFDRTRSLNPHTYIYIYRERERERCYLRWNYQIT